MKCPYCKQEMKAGQMHAPSSYAIYWLPEGANAKGMMLTAKKIEEAGGIVVDEATKVGFFSQNKPKTYYCTTCDILLTKKGGGEGQAT